LAFGLGGGYPSKAIPGQFPRRRAQEEAVQDKEKRKSTGMSHPRKWENRNRNTPRLLRINCAMGIKGGWVNLGPK